MKTLVVVNGSVDWSPFFPGYRVRQVWVQTSRWFLDRGRLWIQDRSGTVAPDGVLWRLGAIEPHPSHRACLALIRACGVPCCNPAKVLLRGYDRLEMLIELAEAGLPTFDLSAAVGQGALAMCSPTFPAVVKSGNLHGGQGKGRALSAEVWDDFVSLLEPRGTYTTIEPFLDYTRDVRCLAVHDQVWAMERRSQGWKANVSTSSYTLIEAPHDLKRWTLRAMEHFQADVLGLDFIQDRDGSWVLLESNDIPGVLGFPEEVCQSIARIVRDRMDLA